VGSPITTSALIEEMSKLGYEIGPQREGNIQRILRNLFLAGYL
jgi:hypothetical protein